MLKIARTTCPASLCDCQLASLLQAPTEQQRILLLSRAEEQRLLQRLEQLSSYEDLLHMQQRMEQQLGIRSQIQPGPGTVRSMRGIQIEVLSQPGLCRKSRQAIARAIRRGLENNPQVAWKLLDAHDLFGL